MCVRAEVRLVKIWHAHPLTRNPAYATAVYIHMYVAVNIEVKFLCSNLSAKPLLELFIYMYLFILAL